VKESAATAASIYRDCADKVADYLIERAKLLGEGFTPRNERDTCLAGIFLRTAALMKSVRKLNQSSDFQVILSANRTLLELAVDAILIFEDKTGDAAGALLAWERSAKLNICEELVAYYGGAASVPPRSQPQVAFIDRNKTAIEADRDRLWPAWIKRWDGKRRHPERWTGNALRKDVRRADEVARRGLTEIYETKYREMCLMVHGQGLAGMRNLEEHTFHLVCMLGYDGCVSLTITAADLCFKGLDMSRAYPVKEELRVFVEERNRRLQSLPPPDPPASGKK